jgi:hypothetical protein
MAGKQVAEKTARLGGGHGSCQGGGFSPAILVRNPYFKYSGSRTDKSSAQRGSSPSDNVLSGIGTPRRQ